MTKSGFSLLTVKLVSYETLSKYCNENEIENHLVVDSNDLNIYPILVVHCEGVHFSQIRHHFLNKVYNYNPLIHNSKKSLVQYSTNVNVQFWNQIKF